MVLSVDSEDWEFLCRGCGQPVTWEWWMRYDLCDECQRTELMEDEAYRAWCDEREKEYAAELDAAY